MTQNKDQAPEDDLAGFASAQQRSEAAALIEQCAKFKGAGEALAGRSARLSQGASVSFEPGWVSLPASALRDIGAGPMGRLGMAIMGAAAEFTRAQSAPARPVSASRVAAPAPAPAAKSGNSAWLDEAPSDRPELRVERFEQPKPKRVFAQEGEGEESFAYLVKRLEDSGFGGTSNAQIAANRAKAKPRKGF